MNNRITLGSRRSLRGPGVVALVSLISALLLSPAAPVGFGVAVLGTACLGTSRTAFGAEHPTELQAREAFAAGRFDDALTLFAKLYAETLHPVYLRNIGRCHQKMRAPEKAIDSFRDYISKSKKISATERTEIEGYIHEMEALRDEQAAAAKAAKVATPPAVVVTPPPATTTSANPTTTGLGVVPPPSAEPPVLVSSPGTDASADKPVYEKWWFWTGVGAVVVGGVVTAILLSGGTSKPSCPSGVVCQ